MLGVNCTPPAYMEALIHRLCQNTSLPVAVYPNSGEEYDPRTKGWHGQQAGPSFGEYAERWMRAGAQARAARPPPPRMEGRGKGRLSGAALGKIC